jgi:prepilin-type N-terminal cleavage/methylation domain-containing protein
MGAAQGFTLFEVLLALAASALLLSAVMPMLSMSVAAATNPATSDQADLDRQAAFAVERIARAVRAKAPAVLAAPPGATGLLALLNAAPQDPGTTGTWLAPATFTLTGSKAPYTLTEKRDGDAVLHIIADSVESLQFTALPVSDGRQLIRVDLTLRSANASSTVSSVMRMGWLQ